MIQFEKFGQRQPLNRQAERYAKEGVGGSLSTLADQVGAGAFALQPIHDLIRAHGHDDLCGAAHTPAPVQGALCWRHARREFFELADTKATARKGRPVAEEVSPIALAAVKGFDAIVDAGRALNGLTTNARHDPRQQPVRPMIASSQNRARLSINRTRRPRPIDFGLARCRDG